MHMSSTSSTKNAHMFIHCALARTLIVSSLALALLACDKPSEQPASPDAARPTERVDAPPSSADATPKLEAQPAAIAPTRPASFADIVEGARPAVINIYTRTRVRAKKQNPFIPFAPRDQVGESLGSGFIIDASGLALTNHHVIKNATDIEVRLLDERMFKAKVVGQDPKTDTALIQIETKGEELPSLELGDSQKLRVGDWVIAIGNPLGLSSSVTAGIASATGRKHVPLGGELVYQDFIQTDASINPGNSGGALINTAGEVVGINTAISAEAQGIGFAIPINMVKELLPQLKQGKVKRSWLGIYIKEVPGALAKQLGIPKRGALITDVVPGGPADLAKLRRGDVLLEVDNEALKDSAHLSWIAGHKGVGKSIDITLQRGGQLMKTRLKLGALPD